MNLYESIKNNLENTPSENKKWILSKEELEALNNAHFESIRGVDTKTGEMTLDFIEFEFVTETDAEFYMIVSPEKDATLLDGVKRYAEQLNYGTAYNEFEEDQNYEGRWSRSEFDEDFEFMEQQVNQLIKTLEALR